MARSIKKGPYVAEKLFQKIQKNKEASKKEVIKTWYRSSMILPEFVGNTIAVHDGRKFQSVFITENMVGHLLGEFAPTRTSKLHSGQRQAQKGGK